MQREHAEHFWPWNPKALARTPSTASSKSAEASTMMAFLPPISQTTFFTWVCGFAGQSCGFDDVQAYRFRSSECDQRNPGSLTNCTPTVSPGRAGSATHLRGHQAKEDVEQHPGDPVVCSAGFMITGFPVTSAATDMPHKMARGKFHGAMTARGRGLRGSTHCAPRRTHRVAALQTTEWLRGRRTRRSRWLRRFPHRHHASLFHFRERSRRSVRRARARMMAAARVRTFARTLGSSSRQRGNACGRRPRLARRRPGGVHGLMGHGGGVDGGLESGPNRFVGKIAWSFIHIRSVIANPFDSRSQRVVRALPSNSASPDQAGCG